ncbi:protein FAM200A-like [Watersipora subatra]|uniref:protein FAM200A-like n=1 Tax=Watersipora subatra TaxID=2589382 RepID=UPI00355BD1AA
MHLRLHTWLIYLPHKLNLKLQGSNHHVLAFHDSIDAFKAKLVLWHTQTCTGNTVSFPTLTELLEDKPAPGSLVATITEHLFDLKTEFGRYFPELPSEKKKMLNITRNPFQRTVEEIPEELQEEFIELVNNSALKDDFRSMSIDQFWLSARNLSPFIAEKAIKILMPFSSTYLCEVGFSSILHLKTEKRNRLDLESDLRCALSKTKPDLCKLAQRHQQQPSH